MISNVTPEFVIIGSFNEGKSSLVSTLAEDDTVPVDPIAGNTSKTRAFPLIFDGKEIIRFFDTPGFQNPELMLTWMKKYTGPSKDILKVFIVEHKNDPEFKNECELFAPVLKGAGIIYVIDGSHSVTDHARAEMEILRLTGLPRMSVVNCKNSDTSFPANLKIDLLKNFNSIRHLNACQSTYTDRIGLFECFNRISEDWYQPEFSIAIDAIKRDWDNRNKTASKMILLLLEAALTTNLSMDTQEETFDSTGEKKLKLKFEKKIKAIEKLVYKKIQDLYKHNMFNSSSLIDSIFPEQLLVDKIQQCDVLYSKKSSFIARAGSFLKPYRIRPDLEQIKIGAVKDIQFLFILIDRAFLFYSCIINRAHGRRDNDLGMSTKTIQDVKEKHLTMNWDENKKTICSDFFRSVHENNRKKKKKMRLRIQAVLQESLNNMSLPS